MTLGKIVTVLVASTLVASSAMANCLPRPEGQVVEIKARSCEAIVAEKNKDVQAHVGPLFDTWNLKKAYTGALVEDEAGHLWMYPSDASSPCREFTTKTAVKKKAYYTCCDWLGDVDGTPINSFQ